MTQQGRHEQTQDFPLNHVYMHLPVIEVMHDKLADESSLWLHAMQAAALWMPLSSIDKGASSLLAACSFV